METAETEWLSVTVDVWHPDCWVLRTSRETDVGVLGNGTNVHGGTATGWYTLYGSNTAAIDGAVETIRASSLTDRAEPLAPAGTAQAGAAGTVACDVVVEFDAGPSIRGAFTDRGFTHRGRTRYEDGRERRPFLVRGRRAEVRRALDTVADGYDAEIDVCRLSPATDGNGARQSTDRLSPRQREAFELARRRGYYEYPRDATAGALATELGISKATFLEHLRKAEGKLLTAGARR